MSIISKVQKKQKQKIIRKKKKIDLKYNNTLEIMQNEFNYLIDGRSFKAALGYELCMKTFKQFYGK